MSNATHTALPAGTVEKDWVAIKRLFRAGSGVQPPLMAGRESEMNTFAEILEDLQEEAEMEGDVVLFGPRGNGKTVLLDRFRAACREAGVATLALDPSEINDPGALALELLKSPHFPDADGLPATDKPILNRIGNAARRVTEVVSEAGRQTLPEAGTLHVSGVQAGVSGAKLTLEQMSPERLAAALRPLLAERCRQRPLMVTLDEAHTLDEEVGRRLLNLSQHLRTTDKVPFLLALAGTPNLRVHLSAIGSTFWTRATKLGIGRISEAATREALIEPLEPHGVTFSEDALATVVAESQQYPYFIQVWGKALCKALVEQGCQRIDADTVAAAGSAFEEERTDYYADRYNELEKQKLLPVARTVTGLFAQAPKWDRTALKERLCADLSLEEDDALNAIQHLAHLGYLWEDYGKDLMEPGIPSLMSYVGERLGRPAPDVAPMPEEPEPDPPGFNR